MDLKNKMGVCVLNSHCSRYVAGVRSFSMMMSLRVPLTFRNLAPHIYDGRKITL